MPVSFSIFSFSFSLFPDLSGSTLAFHAGSFASRTHCARRVVRPVARIQWTSPRGTGGRLVGVDVVRADDEHDVRGGERGGAPPVGVADERHLERGFSSLSRFRDGNSAVLT